MRNLEDRPIPLRMVFVPPVTRGRRRRCMKKPSDPYPTLILSLLLHLRRHEYLAIVSKAGSTAPRIPSSNHHLLRSRFRSSQEAPRNRSMTSLMLPRRPIKVTDGAATDDGPSQLLIRLILSMLRAGGRVDGHRARLLTRQICLAHQHLP